MTRRIRNVLDALEDETASSPSPAPSARAPRLGGDLVANRMTAFDDGARSAKKLTLLLEPGECAIWPGNARDYKELTQETLAELIDSIRAEGGNRIPAVVRRAPAASGKLYEVVAGTRRHWAIAWLNANHYPDLKLFAVLEDIDDEAAFRLADLENRARADISDFERARNYKLAIDRYYGGVAKRMAERLQLSEAQLSKLLYLADLPTAIVSAFAHPSDIRIRHTEALAPLLNDRSLRPRVEAEAKAIAGEQSLRAAEGGRPIEAAQVVQRLVAAAQVKRPGRPERPPLMAHTGAVVGKVLKDTAREGVTVQITADASVSEEEVLDALRLVIRGAKIRNR